MEADERQFVEAVGWVVAILRDNGHEEEARDLGELMRGAVATEDRALRDAILGEIVRRCHPRWYGELSIEGETNQEWWKALSRLSKAASAFRGAAG
jgi:hypothetical protein